jgi:hypothetical protein
MNSLRLDLMLLIPDRVTNLPNEEGPHITDYETIAIYSLARVFERNVEP